MGTSIWISMAAGIAGTMLMTFYIYLIAYLVKKPFKVIKILGTMITNQTTAARGLSDLKKASTAGYIAHYGVGIFFALIYSWLWSKNIGLPDLKYCIVFGVVSGLLAICAWAAFFWLHPNPPLLQLNSYLVVIFTGHIFFAAGVFSFRAVVCNLSS